MGESFLNGRVVLHPGNCLEVLAQLEECSVDSCVTDPPYHLTSIVQRFGSTSEDRETFAINNNHTGYRRLSAGFMGKVWDGGDVAFRPETWRAVYRVLKPGAHLVACGGTRTYHRMACAIEDAGFEIRDTISWLYGSGFPKSHDVSKSIDRAAGAERQVVGQDKYAARRPNGRAGNQVYGSDERTEWIATAPATDAARQWQGWGTALKPACELIVLARKPLSEGTVAANVLRWGTGAINVDGCRVVANDEIKPRGSSGLDTDIHEGWARPWMEDRAEYQRRQDAAIDRANTMGRWPANLIHDGSDEVVKAFPETGISNGRDSRGRVHQAFTDDARTSIRDDVHDGFGDTGSAARFFYTAKADADDRLGSKHPTVKPLDLMQWLVRLVTPKGGTCLDCFAGTGTTGEAAFRERCNAVLIEAEPEYQADIRRRMALVLAGPDERTRESIKAKNLPVDYGPLFGFPEAAE